MLSWLSLTLDRVCTVGSHSTLEWHVAFVECVHGEAVARHGALLSSGADLDCFKEAAGSWGQLCGS